MTGGNERQDGAGSGNGARFGASQAGLDEEQLAAVKDLSRENEYVRQSKWATLKQLPWNKKGQYFCQNFLLQIVMIAAAAFVVLSLVFHAVFKAPDAKLYVAGFNMPGVSKQFDTLKGRFLESSGLDAKLVTFDGTMTVEQNALTDNTQQLIAMVTSGTINSFITDRDTFDTLREGKFVTRLDKVLTKQQLAQLEGTDALIHDDDGQGSGPDTPVALELSHSKQWGMLKGMPEDAVLAFANVTVSGTDYPQAFVRFLDFQ